MGEVKVGGVDGDIKRGTKATGGGRDEKAKKQADVAVDINKRVPPGVLNDSELQKLATNHAQCGNPLEESEVGRIYGGISSTDQDDGKAI